MKRGVSKWPTVKEMDLDGETDHEGVKLREGGDPEWLNVKEVD